VKELVKNDGLDIRAKAFKKDPKRA